MPDADRLWTPISQEEIKRWRKRLPKGWVREFNTATTVGLEPADPDGDDRVAFEKPSAKVTQPLPPRQVADDVFGQVWEWASKNRDNFRLLAQIVRHNNPSAFGHLTDDQLAEHLEQHAREAARKATRTVYQDSRNRWDHGNDLDMWNTGVVKRVGA